MGDQAESLRQKLHHSKLTKAKTIAIVSGKGGVGKSNIALNFAIELRQQGKKVLLIDMDFGMGNIEVLIGLKAEKTIVDLFQHHLTLSEIIEQGPKSLKFIAGGSGLTDLFSLTQEDMDFFFTQYEQAIYSFDYILFDMGAGVDEVSMSFILSSDECLVITTPEPTAITDAYSMIKHIVNNERETPIYLVMNRSESEKSGMKMAERFRQVVSQFLHKDIDILGVLPYDKLVSKAVIRQIPYVLMNDKAAISKAIRKLVHLFLNTETRKIEPLSFIDKLKLLIRKR